MHLKIKEYCYQALTIISAKFKILVIKETLFRGVHTASPHPLAPLGGNPGGDTLQELHCKVGG